jgi:transmembrane 9 superfamily protein 1
MAMFGLFNVHRHGSLNTAAILLYALTSGVAGYVSAKCYKQMGGEHWVRNINFAACIFTVPFFITWAIVNR